MKKVFLITLLVTSLTNAQSYLGYLNDNYAGVHGVINNPSSIVDSRFKTDINLFSFSALAGNDYYGIDIFKALKTNYDLEKDSKFFPSSNNNFIANIDILGPSFMFNISPKHSIAVFSRARGIANVIGISGDYYNVLRDGSNKSFNVSNQNYNIIANTWSEIGITYATILLNKDQNFIKIGVSLKYLQGYGNTYINANNVSVNYTRNDSNVPASSIATSGTITFGGYSNNTANNNKDIFYADAKNPGTGFGADLGFTYEYRPNYADFSTDDKNLNKYKLRIGLSVTDIGSINYKSTNEKTFDINNIVSQAQYDLQNQNGTSSVLNNLYSKIGERASTKANLPMAIHANADWNFYNKFYLNTNIDYSLIAKNTINGNSIQNSFSVTPRYEVKWFSFYLPVSYLQYSGTQAGLGFRLGPLFVGSGSLVSNLISKESKGVDLHVGLKIPVYQARKKDKDGDGVVDKNDNCPDIAGPVENKGCPWSDKDKDGTFDKDDKCPDVSGPTQNKGCPYPDKDNDGVLDKDDKCPDVAGVKENKGCPYPDKDKDGVYDKDDKCPDVAGAIENKGCPYPDTDGDTVLDKDDKCPTEKGTVANLGCPEKTIELPIEVAKVDKKVLETLNEYSKSILFDSGKATIKSESYSNLDAIVLVMNQYLTNNFKIEGYTDNAGKPKKNVLLSKNRAASVKTYLISKGVALNRLTSDGFGSAKPIASNKTTLGKMQNRRVEIKLAK